MSTESYRSDAHQRKSLDIKVKDFESINNEEIERLQTFTDCLIQHIMSTNQEYFVMDLSSLPMNIE